VRRAAALLALSITGCASAGMIDDGTSVSFGPPGRGSLIAAVPLPSAGEGFWMPPTWRDRGLRYGTEELISFLVHLGRALTPHRLGRPVAIADLSPERGGPSAWHRSHQTGRDVDIVFFARDARGRPVAADRMRRYDADGLSADGVRFDDRANWALVRALIENPVAEVQYIFVSDDLKQRLIDTAVAEQAPPELVAAAAYLLQQPTTALPHDDHMHIRIYCAPSDLPLGCRDVGTLRWYKKDYKYGARRAADLGPVRDALRSQQPVLTALPGLPFRGFVPR
jgi:penicillin-insensitive murein endopeptidase